MSGLRAFLEKQGSQPCLRRWIVLLTLVHLIVSATLAWTRSADELLVIQDAGEYIELAGYPLTHGIYSLDGVQSSGKREPGYSGFIMAFMAAGIVKPHVITVANLWIIAGVQILLYGWVCGYMARKLVPFFGAASSWLGLMIMQASPIAEYQYSLGNECVTMILLGLFAVEIGVHWRQGASWASVLRAALWMGLLAITKSVNVLFIPPLCLLLWIRTPAKFLKVAAFFIIALLPAIGWMMRNKAALGIPVMGSIDGFSSLYRANILPYYQISSPDHPDMPEEAKAAIAACKSDAEKYQWYKKAALDWLKANPLQYVKQCLHRTAAMFIELYRQEDIPWWRYPFVLLVGNDQLFLTIVLVLCALPLWRRQDIWVEMTVLFFLFSVGIYGAVYGQERYLHPAFFLLAPVHAWCLVEVVGPWISRRLANKKCC